MQSDNKLLYQIALTQINGVGDIIGRNLLNIVGDEEEIFKSGRKSLLAIKNISTKLVNAILDPEVLRKAEKELLFVEKNKLKTFFINEDNYPERLRECADAPLLLYYKGNAELNAEKIISIVGTRKGTDYGNRFCMDFIADIKSYFPETLIISGLAYGIDIYAHRAALKEGLGTVGVLAHGLDRIYPHSHRKTAVEMLQNGGLLTEFTSNIEPDRFNFVRRNRIVAGLADAVIVVESDNKGGSLITAEIGNSYNKDVFAVPGRITDTYSKGCNKLISENKAILLHSTENFLQQMNWINEKKKKKVVQQSLFSELNENEQRIYNALSGCESKHVNQLSVEVDVPVSQLFFTLLEMEMKNILKPLPGGTYKLVE